MGFDSVPIFSAFGTADGTPLQTAAADATGANFIFVALQANFATLGNSGDVTDNYSNVYTPLTVHASNATFCCYYIASPTVGAGQVIQCNAPGFFGGIIFAQGWKTAAAIPFDVENQSSGTGPFQTGNNGSCSLTPGGNGELLFSVVLTRNQSTPSFSVNSGYTPTAALDHPPLDMASGYLVQVSGATEDPLWTFDTSATQSFVLASAFKPPAATFDPAQFPYSQFERPTHFSKLIMIDSGPRPGRGI